MHAAVLHCGAPLTQSGRLHACWSPPPSPTIAATAATANPAAAAVPKPPPRPKTAEQLTPEELEKALPSMVFTTSNLIWSTIVASGVAAAGLVSMIWLGAWIVNAADGMRAPAGSDKSGLAGLAAGILLILHGFDDCDTCTRK
jgi:hypothetical protein